MGSLPPREILPQPPSSRGTSEPVIARISLVYKLSISDSIDVHSYVLTSTLPAERERREEEAAVV